jgi:hypothetical protein
MALETEAAAPARIALDQLLDDEIALAFVESLLDQLLDDAVENAVPLLRLACAVNARDHLPEHDPGDVVARGPALVPVALPQFGLPLTLFLVANGFRFASQADLFMRAKGKV